MCCPLTPYEASRFCAPRLGSTPSLHYSSRFTLRSILTTLYTLSYIDTLRPATLDCDCDLRPSTATATLRPSTATATLQLRSTAFIQATATPLAPAFDVYHTTPLFPSPFYTSTSSFYRRSSRIKRLAPSALASAAYHSQIQTLTARLGVCCVCSFLQARASASPLPPLTW